MAELEGNSDIIMSLSNEFTNEEKQALRREAAGPTSSAERALARI